MGKKSKKVPAAPAPEEIGRSAAYELWGSKVRVADRGYWFSVMYRINGNRMVDHIHLTGVSDKASADTAAAAHPGPTAIRKEG